MATSITQFQPGKDDQEVLGLRAEVWGSDHPHTAAPFYAWLFGNGSCGTPSGILVRKDDRLVCFAGLVPRTVECNGKMIRVAHGLDFMASPSLQGLSGLYAFKLVKAWIEHAKQSGYDFAACYPNEQSIRLLISDKLNWKIVASPRLLVLPTASIRFEETPIKSLPLPLVNIGGKIAGGMFGLLRNKGSFQSEIGKLDLQADALAINDLWSRSDQSRCQFSHTAGLLSWRYGNHPIYKYRLLCRRTDEGLKGFIVTTHRKVMGVESELVIDGVWEKGDTETPLALLSAVYQHAIEERAGIVAGLAMKGTFFYAALRKAGLIEVPAKFDPKPFHLVGFALSEAAEPHMNQKAWNTVWGDMDVV